MTKNSFAAEVTFKNTLNDHGPIKTLNVHENTKPHAIKILREEITKRSILKNQAINQAKLPTNKF